MKHTPGPWFVSRATEDELDKGHPAFLVKPIPGQVVCELDALPEEEANAYLIAASPKMLNTLEGAHFFFTGIYDRLVNSGEEEELLDEVSKTLEVMSDTIKEAKCISVISDEELFNENSHLKNENDNLIEERKQLTERAQLYADKVVDLGREKAELLEALQLAKEELTFLFAQNQNNKFWSEESEMRFNKIREAIAKAKG